jgi:hypothetical protein
MAETPKGKPATPKCESCDGAGWVECGACEGRGFMLIACDKCLEAEENTRRGCTKCKGLGAQKTGCGFCYDNGRNDCYDCDLVAEG